MNDYDKLIDALIGDGLMDPETGEIFSVVRMREATGQWGVEIEDVPLCVFRGTYFMPLWGDDAMTDLETFNQNEGTGGLSSEVADWERTLWDRPPPGNGLARDLAEWEQTLFENGRGGEE